MADGDFDPDSLLTAPPPASATMKITPAKPDATPAPAKLSYDDIVDRARAQGYSDAGARGIADNFERESGGASSAPGDYVDGQPTSLGIAQWHNERKAALIKFAQDQGKSPIDPDVQFAFLDKEMREQYPQLRASLVNAKDQQQAEEQFKRIFERPKSVMWQNYPSGAPVLGNDRFRFADDAMSQHDDADLLYMHPRDYLALSPSMDSDSGYSAAGWQSLRSSLANGQPVRQLPTLDTTITGPTATVTGQDGRSRALMASMAGIDAIPVAVRQKGEGTPSEIQGMQGGVVPMSATAPAGQFAAEKGSGGSLIGRFLGISPAEAAEPSKSDENFWADKSTPVEAAGEKSFWEQGSSPVVAETPKSAPAKDDLPWDVPMTGAEMREEQKRTEAADKALPLSSLEPSKPGFGHLVWSALAGLPQMAVRIGQTALGERPFPTPTQATEMASIGVAPEEAPVPKPGIIAKSFRINASEQAKETIGAGFVLPPAEASVGHIGETNLANMAAGEAGKIKLGQYAAAKNQPMVNLYAQRDLGLEPGTTLTPQVFKQVRDREGQVYQEVASAVPEVDLARDKEFVDEVNNVGQRSEVTERLFPSTKEPPGVTALRAELKAHQRGDTKAVMNYIADLRMRATQNFRKEGDAMAHRMGSAEREAATALEDALERSVKNAPGYYREKLAAAQKTRDEIYKERPQQGLPLQGQVVEAANAEVQRWADLLANANAKNQANQTLLERFRRARQIMAKSYDVESVTNVSTGDVSAHGLGKLLQQGKPLTGDLKLIADSANSFSRAFADPARFGGVESYSVFDAAAAAALALHGHPIAATMVGARPLLRARQMSPWYQRRMISEPQPGHPSSLPSVVRGAVVATPTAGPTPADAATQGQP